MQDRFECVRNDFDRAPIPRRAARPWYDPAMRRLARWTLNALTVLSPLMWAATTRFCSAASLRSTYGRSNVGWYW
jgi:hypothetical protein